MKKKLSLVVCLLVILAFCAKAQYSNMPQPIMAKNVSAFRAYKLSFSPDSRYIAAEYEDVEKIKHTTIVEIATGKELTSSQTGYPWTETQSSKYEVIDKYNGSGDISNPELCIKEKSTGKKVYGIDIYMRQRTILEVDALRNLYLINISPNNNFVALISDTNNTELREHRSKLSSRANLEALIIAMNAAEEDISNEVKQANIQSKEITEHEKIVIALGDKIAQIEIFRITDLPSYKSYTPPSVTLPKGVYYNWNSREERYCDYIVIHNINGDKYGITNREKIIVMPKYDYIYTPAKEEKYVLVENGNLRGLVELTTGKEVVPVKYEQVYTRAKDEKYVSVENGNLRGLVELTTGKEVVPIKYEHVYTPVKEEKYVLVENGNYTEGKFYGVVDLTNGKEVLAVKYQEINIVGSNASVKENGKAKVIDLVTGKETTSEEEVFSIYPLESNRVVLMDGDGIGKIKDTKTNQILATYFVSDILFGELAGGEFVNGFSRVYKDDSTDALGGFIDKKGDLVVPMIYEKLWTFSEGLAAVKKGGKWGFIDKNNKTVIPFVYDDASEEGFVSGKTKVKKSGKWIKIDKTGKCVEGCN